MQARPGWSAGAARWLTETFQPVFWLTAATIWGTAADRQSANARGDLATHGEAVNFRGAIYRCARAPPATPVGGRKPREPKSENSRARRGVEMAQLEATVGSLQARRAKLISNRGRDDER